jgi:hypothetical protein
MNSRHRKESWPLLLWPLTLCFALAVGCHSIHLTTATDTKPEKEAAPVTPGKLCFRHSQYVFYSDFELNRRLPLFSELAQLRDQVYRDLRLPSCNTVVHVYLFEDRDRYERFMRSKYPELPRRRAFFVAQPRGVGAAEDLLVYTYWGDRIQEDLRHELTHALLHSVLKDVPLWLDEGLAENFEVPPSWRGINYHHLDHLRREGGEATKPDLARLEQLSQVQQMAPAEYREAWAWVHFMLHANAQTRHVLIKYLQELRTISNPGLLKPRLAAVVPDLDADLERHLARLDNSNRPQWSRLE